MTLPINKMKNLKYYTVGIKAETGFLYLHNTLDIYLKTIFILFKIHNFLPRHVEMKISLLQFWSLTWL
jgi:hypothetical protein